MSTPIPSPSMNGMIGSSGVGVPGTIFVPSSGTSMRDRVLNSLPVSDVAAHARGEASPDIRPLGAVAVRTDVASAQAVAQAVLEGFDKHYRLFRAATSSAKQTFEEAAWTEAQRVVGDRIEFYDQRVTECVERLRTEFDVDSIALGDWKEVKLAYIALLVEHLQPELAETFFNSVTTRLFASGYSDNAGMFVRAALSTEYVDSEPPVVRSYYPEGGDLESTFRQIFHD